MILVDTNVLVDVVTKDTRWAAWSLWQLRTQAQVHALVINPAVYAELSMTFDRIGLLDETISDLDLEYQEMSRPALYLAGVAHRHYRRSGGIRLNVLADFFIGAHAAVAGCAVLTRDPSRYRNYFPSVEVIAP